MHPERRAVLGDRPATAAEYQPLTCEQDDQDSALDGAAGLLHHEHEIPFSWLEYSIFAFLGVAMLWAWNMFLAAAPYFSSRFASDAWIRANFQSGILTVSTVTNLGALLVLSNIQDSASYPFRINLALLLNTVMFSLLTASTAVFVDASPAAYFAFLLLMVAFSSWATGLIQNGAFAFAASYGRPEYMQALMAGQALAGVLPAVAQVAAVLLFPSPNASAGEDSDGGLRQGQSSAFFYFLAAVAISVLAMMVFVPLVRRRNRRLENRMTERLAESTSSIEEAERAPRKATSLWLLFRKLRWLAVGIATTFAVTMFFPVFTAKIDSVREDAGAIFRPAAFIPLGFLFWNLGDLGGRVATMLPFSLGHRPFALFLLALARVAQLPLYLLCNINGRGALVSSDFFYLFVVQVSFGLTNGWLGSSFMMASGEWVEEGEREATGGFMGFCLVVGLTIGSLLSFTASGT